LARTFLGGDRKGAMSDVTRILEAIEQGDRGAARDLLPLVYAELRQLARAKMAQQSAGHTLQPTALVHEAWLRLVGSERQLWQGRNHFFAAAAEAMRHILVDSARRKRRAKHGGGLERVNVDDVEVAAGIHDEKMLLVHEALEKLTLEDPLRAEVVKLHYFAGLTHAETAEVLHLSEKTVRRHWNYSRVWLYQAILASEGMQAPGPGKS
jgi:RNA polymerase sigma factor (TIGR02999 family)